MNRVNKSVRELVAPPGCKVKVQQSYGRPLVTTVMSYDLQTKSLCDRQDCLVCTHGESKGRCRVEGVNYQISCNRPPCNTHLTSNPLEFPPTTDTPLTLYRGESSRTSYRRGKQHLVLYRGNNDSSVLWKHTLESHNGQKDGVKDYRMSVLDHCSKPLDRQTSEGLWISELEGLQLQGKAKSLNSKEDFYQSSRVTLQFQRGLS